MYPDFYHLLKDLTGIQWPWLSLLKTFGFLVALSFFSAAYFLYRELKRKEEAGLIPFTIDEITTGKPLAIKDLVIQALLGGLAGFKLGGMIQEWRIASPDPLSYLFSMQGNWKAGLLAAIGLALIKYLENRKEQASGLQTKKVKTFPHVRVGDFAMLAAIGGFAGAKLFNAFETWDSFVNDPLGSLFSSSGLTFYGGLIIATLVLWIYARKIKLDFRHLCDAAAPALMLAYGIGRLGCQVSGDGDWGIYNSAYITNAQGQVALASDTNFVQHLTPYKEYFQRHEKEGLDHVACKGPSSLPVWLFAYNYPHNVNNVGVALPGCHDSEYCSVLPQPVFPTPIYECVVCVLLFVFLWGIRKRFEVPLGMFAVYLVLNGIERFLVEQIRVNYQYHIFGLQPTQAELIAILLILTGILLFLLRKQIHRFVQPKDAVPFP